MVQNKSVITRQNRCWFFFLHFWHSACLCVLSREPRPIKNLILPALHAQHGPHWMEAHPPLLWRIQLYPAASTFPSGSRGRGFPLCKVQQRHWISADFRPVHSWLLFLPGCFVEQFFLRVMTTKSKLFSIFL